MEDHKEQEVDLLVIRFEQTNFATYQQLFTTYDKLSQEIEGKLEENAEQFLKINVYPIYREKVREVVRSREI